MHGIILICLRPGEFYNKRKMDEGLAKAAKAQNVKEEVAKILANKTLGSNLVWSALMLVNLMLWCPVFFQ